MFKSRKMTHNAFLSASQCGKKPLGREVGFPEFFLSAMVRARHTGLSSHTKLEYRVLVAKAGSNPEHTGLSAVHAPVSFDKTEAWRC